MIKITKNWFNILGDEFEKPYFKELQKKVEEEYFNYKVYPKMENIFNALNYVKFEDVKVVILGQDPYHQPNQAMGLSFSVPDDVKIPPSLQNIFKEIEENLDIKCNNSGNLIRWAKQGVLLLNTVLTVRDSSPNSHKNLGWIEFTNAIIKKLNERNKPIIFVLWGGNAKPYKDFITNKIHHVLMASHPSPLSAYNGFFGCKHFSKINQILLSYGEAPIDWK